MSETRFKCVTYLGIPRAAGGHSVRPKIHEEHDVLPGIRQGLQHLGPWYGECSRCGALVSVVT